MIEAFSRSSSCREASAPVIATAAHPAKPWVFSGLSTGQVLCLRVGDEDARRPVFSEEVASFDLLHNDSCRGILVSKDGSKFFTISADRSIALTDLKTLRPKAILPDAHNAPLQSCSWIAPQLVATGDDDGVLRIWDERTFGKNAAPVVEFNDHIDFISAILPVSLRKTLITGGGDGYLHVYDLRKNKCKASSDPLHEEILSMALMKEGQRLVCGMQDGSLSIFTWDEWAYPSDRLLGHPSSIDSMVPLTSSILATGGGDGFLRYVTIQPNSLLGWTAIPHLFDGEEPTDSGLPSAVDVVSNEDFWPISTMCSLQYSSISDQYPLLVCGSQERLYVTASHHRFLRSALEADEKDEILDVGDVEDTRALLPKHRQSAMPIPSKKGKRRKFSKGFMDQKELESTRFFQDLVDDNEEIIDPVNT